MTAAEETPEPRLTDTEQTTTGPNQSEVDKLRELLDLMDGFSDNDQRARFLLSSNWLRDYRA